MPICGDCWADLFPVEYFPARMDFETCTNCGQEAMCALASEKRLQEAKMSDPNDPIEEAPPVLDTEYKPTVFNTPEGIAFVKAAARLGALKLGKPGLLKIVKEVYGFDGGTKKVIGLLEDYVNQLIAIRAWSPEYAERIQAIGQAAIDAAELEHPGDRRLKVFVDAEVQYMYDCGAITEQEGNDACTLVYVEVVRRNAGRL